MMASTLPGLLSRRLAMIPANQAVSSKTRSSRESGKRGTLPVGEFWLDLDRLGDKSGLVLGRQR